MKTPGGPGYPTPDPDPQNKNTPNTPDLGKSARIGDYALRLLHEQEEPTPEANPTAGTIPADGTTEARNAPIDPSTTTPSTPQDPTVQGWELSRVDRPRPHYPYYTGVNPASIDKQGVNDDMAEHRVDLVHPVRSLTPGQKYPRIQDVDDRKKALTHLEHELHHRASDSKGSDPTLYLSAYDLELCRLLSIEAKKTVDQNGKDRKPWPGATEIYHTEASSRRGKDRKKKPEPLRDENGNPIKGYRIGYLNVRQFQTPVLYCSDGKLRMAVTPGHGKKTYAGYATLPEAKDILVARDVGRSDAVSLDHQQNETLKSEIKKFSGGKINGIDIQMPQGKISKQWFNGRENRTAQRAQHEKDRWEKWWEKLEEQSRQDRLDQEEAERQEQAQRKAQRQQARENRDEAERQANAERREARAQRKQARRDRKHSSSNAPDRVVENHEIPDVLPFVANRIVDLAHRDNEARDEQTRLREQLSDTSQLTPDEIAELQQRLTDAESAFDHTTREVSGLGHEQPPEGDDRGKESPVVVMPPAPTRRQKAIRAIRNRRRRNNQPVEPQDPGDQPTL